MAEEMDVAMYLEGGRKHIKEKDGDRAVADLTEAIRIDPNCAEAYYLRSRAYYARAVTHNRGLVYDLTVGAIQEKMKDDKAIADIRMAIKLDPKNDGYYAQLKMVLGRVPTMKT